MGQPVYWIGGSKGGVGKSIVAMALLDHLAQRGEETLLIESDTANADVWKAYGKHVASEVVNLDEADGWIHLVNVCERDSVKTVVVNTAARNNVGVTKFGQTLNSTLADLKRKLVTIWVINRQRDSLELLHEFREALPNALVHVLRNGHFGDEKKFELYNGSELRKLVESAGGRSLTFPDLADRVADDLFVRRLAIAEALRDLPLGNRAELSRWRAEVTKTFTEATV